MDLNMQMDEILRIRRSDPTKELRLVREFRKNLKLSKHQDPEKFQYMHAFSDTYLCESYLLLGDVKKAADVGLKALKFQQKAGIEDLFLISVNLMGFVYGCMENYVGAATLFCTGIEIATKRQDYAMLRVLYANFGVSYCRLRQYDRAKDMFDKSFSLCELIGYPEDKMKIARMEYEEEMAEYYYGVGEYEKALLLIDETTPAYELMKAKIAVKQSDVKEAELAIGRYLDLKCRPVNALEQFDTYRILADVAIKIKHQYYTTVCLDRMLESATKCDIANYWSSYYDYLIRATELFGWEAKENLYERFFTYQEQVASLVEANQGACIANELEIYKNRKKQKALQKKNERMRQLSIQDELTKAYNRAGLQTYIDDMLDMAKNRKVPFGICMVDLDYFKVINDSFGHLFGDECLKTVAKVLKLCFGKEAVVCRYGGDEFVVITVGMTGVPFESCLKKLITHKQFTNVVEKERKKGNEKENPGVIHAITLSVGAVNCVPNSDTTSTDYLYTADKLLYQVKSENKNEYRMTTELL